MKCLLCPNPAADLFHHCDGCLRKAMGITSTAQRSREIWARKRAKGTADGTCMICSTAPARPGMKTCAACGSYRGKKGARKPTTREETP